MPRGTTALTQEFEAAAAQAKSFGELRDLSAEYVERHKQDVVTKLERTRWQANRRKTEAERAQSEVGRLRQILALLATELESRAPRLVRADLEDLRSIVRRGVAPQHFVDPSPGASPGASSPRSTLLSPRSQSISDIQSTTDTPSSIGFSFRPLSPPSVDHNVWNGGFAVGGGMSPLQNCQSPSAPSSATPNLGGGTLGLQVQVRAADTAHRLRHRIELLEKSQARLKKENDHLRVEKLRAERLLNQASARAQAASPSSPEQSGGSTNSEERLFAVIRRLEKEQAEQQQYADKVVNELGTALRNLETENASLQAELRHGGQKAKLEMQARKRLERQVKSLESEKENLTRKVMAWRSEVSPANDEAFDDDLNMQPMVPHEVDSVGDSDDLGSDT